MLLDDAITEYMYHCHAKNFTAKTIKNKKQEYKMFQKYLSDKRAITELESITVHDMKSYVRFKQANGLKAQSIVSMIKQVKAFFNWCVNEEYITESPMKKVVLPRTPKLLLQGLSVEEVTKIMNAFNKKTYLDVRNKTIIALMADCGLRAMEIATIKESDVQTTQIKVFGKGNKERIVFISPALKKLLIRYERIKKQYFEEKIQYNDNYFLAYQGKAMSTVAVYNLVIEGVERAQIKTDKRISPHMFRHFYATQSLKAGVDIYTLSRLLGHSDISTTQIYLRSLTDDDLSVQAIKSSPLMNLNKK